jgi:hypothetical protein
MPVIVVVTAMRMVVTAGRFGGPKQGKIGLGWGSTENQGGLFVRHDFPAGTEDLS